MGISPAGGPSARDRILDTAYELFSRHGTHAVGVDAIVAGSGVAKMSLYRNFGSKDELILAFLRRREERWGGWLIAEVERAAEEPAARLLAIFDVLGGWYDRQDFEGCSFTKILFTIEDPEHPVRQAAVAHIDNVREWLRSLAADAGIADPDTFARQWYLLMVGSLVAAYAGDPEAAPRAGELGRMLLSAALPERFPPAMN